MSILTQPIVTVYRIGFDALDLPTDGLSDEDVLKEAAKVYPSGFNLQGSNAGPVWVHPQMLLNLAQPDGFGLELQGMAHTAAELVRFACDTEKAEELGGKGIDRLIKMFMAQASGQANAKKPNQLHAHRWGGSAKVVAADIVAPGTIEVHPTGHVAARLAKLFKVKNMLDIGGRTMLVERHPFVFSYVVRIIFNEELTGNLILANRLDWRRALQADCDGDTGAVFPINDEATAQAICNELDAVVPGSDVTGLILNRPCHEDPEWWGEVLEKSTTDKLEQSFTKTNKDWIDSHILMGEYANKFTPFSYRISDVGAAMAAVGIPGAQMTALIGATIEETFYLGLGGGPKELDTALETWFKKKMTRANQVLVMGGLAKVINHELITDRDVRTAIARAGAINRGNFDACDPQELLVHGAFLVGKGRITEGDGTVVRSLAAMAGDPAVPAFLRDSFVAKMLFHAGRKLGQVVGMGKPVEDESQWADEDGPNYGEDYSSDFEE